MFALFLPNINFVIYLNNNIDYYIQFDRRMPNLLFEIKLLENSYLLHLSYKNEPKLYLFYTYTLFINVIVILFIRTELH